MVLLPVVALPRSLETGTLGSRRIASWLATWFGLRRSIGPFCEPEAARAGHVTEQVGTWVW